MARELLGNIKGEPGVSAIHSETKYPVQELGEGNNVVASNIPLMKKHFLDPHKHIKILLVESISGLMEYDVVLKNNNTEVFRIPISNEETGVVRGEKEINLYSVLEGSIHMVYTSIQYPSSIGLKTNYTTPKLDLEQLTDGGYTLEIDIKVEGYFYYVGIAKVYEL